ncbi:MAG: DUF1573 domain-containing protein [Crocinitomicaceae bacterium]|nr:DUF1573 domain-containing protein [Crocinitomicaceae bacterium]
MKKFILSLGLTAMAILFTGVVSAQTETPVVQSNAKIEFDKDVHDYGTIDQGGNGECEFKLKNTGTEPLVIRNARGSCGCTVPTWPKEPIAPGASAVIKVKYDTKRVGVINKSVTVTSNASNEPTKILRIKGTVKGAPAGGSPVNNGGPANN